MKGKKFKLDYDLEDLVKADSDDRENRRHFPGVRITNTTVENSEVVYYIDRDKRLQGKYLNRDEVLDSCLDFGSRTLAVLRLKIGGREAILSRAQSWNIPKFGPENQNIPNFGKSEHTDIWSTKSRHKSIASTQVTNFIK